MKSSNPVEMLHGALTTATMTARAIAAGLELLRMNRIEDAGLSDDHYEAFCWWLEQSVVEVGGVLDMAQHVLRTQDREDTGHDPS